MLEFKNREQCEQFQMSAFDISCATCERSDQECPWDRRDEPTTNRNRSAEVSSTRSKPQSAGAK
jgi:hypothetical protein